MNDEVHVLRLLKPYDARIDVRGRFLGIIQEGHWEEINYLETRAGEVRGGHYHKHTIEIFFIIEGNIEITVRPLNGDSDQTLVVSSGDIIRIEPREWHRFVCTSDCRWINALSMRMAASPDIHQLPG